MRFAIQHPSDNVVTIMRRLGYVFQRQEQDEMSFVRPLAQSGFPRFHCYVKQTNGSYTFNLHLDQKRETYGKDTRHHGEYENEGALKTEFERIEASVGPLLLIE